ncbi:hypothetical protein PCASD_24968 [Puccinia coronata f. sp. avenae]|uniref:Uncharacterized protein n=1 Tax=Puccinia coronata f. sp. avenae TaxID=200324 RepID=A0A2N5T199_9BASI|nr:hypothetical protein PCASD_24968 [Puccinia coronata f. sp. avenae]
MVLALAPDGSSDFNSRAFLADVNKNDWPDAVDFLAIKLRQQKSLCLRLPQQVANVIEVQGHWDHSNYYRPRHSQHPNGTNTQKSQASQSTSRGSVSSQAVEINGLPHNLDDLDFHSMAIGEDLRLQHPCLRQASETPHYGGTPQSYAAAPSMISEGTRARARN